MKILKDTLRWLALAVGLVILWTLNVAMVCAALAVALALLVWLINLNLDNFSFGTFLVDVAFVVASYFLFRNNKMRNLAKGFRDQLKNGL